MYGRKVKLRFLFIVSILIILILSIFLILKSLEENVVYFKSPSDIQILSEIKKGYLKDKNFFSAKKILAKHDENYMPPEVKAALEEK